MKTSIIKTFTVIIMITLTTQAHSKVWRVNNNSGVSADFTSISAAISGAAAGDTLYVEGSPISYGNMSLNKRLTIIGAGYFLSDNDSTQANKNATQFGTITVSSGAQGSLLWGISASSTTANINTVTINTNDITISRCYIYNSPALSSYTYNGTALYLPSGASNIAISQSFIYQARVHTSTSTTYTYNTRAILMDGNNNNIVLLNNIIKHGAKGTLTQTSYYQFAVQMAASSSAIMSNNVIIGAFEAYNSVVTNNIQILGGAPGVYITSTAYPNVSYNNIGHQTQFGTANGNKSNITMTSVFTYGPGNENTDNHYTLKTGSPALAAGIQGEDCGAYGGINAYKKSGLPGIPAIFEALVPPTATTSGGTNINIKAKTHE